MIHQHLGQREDWNGDAGRRWVEGREAIDQRLSSINEVLMAHAAARPGERVLDLGCGCGTTTLMLAERVAPGGSAEGLDISAQMLAVARERAAGRGVRFTEADAATHRFTSTFDLVFSRFGVMFFEDPVAAFRNLRTALAPGGRIAFAAWRALDDNAWVSEPLAAARDLLPPAPSVDPDAPGPFAFADGERVRGILGAAGFTDISVEPHDDVLLLGDTVDEATEATIQVGPLGRAVAPLPEQVQRDVAARVRPVMAAHAGPRGVAPPAAIWLVRAR